MSRARISALLVLAVAMAIACARTPKEQTVRILIGMDRWGEIAPCG